MDEYFFILGHLGNIGSRIEPLLGAHILNFSSSKVRRFDINQQEIFGNSFPIDYLEKVLNISKKDTNMVNIINCLPYFENKKILDICVKYNNIRYFDLSEDIESTKYCYDMAMKAKLANKNMQFIPQCGLAPGMVSIIANKLINEFDSVESVKIRVGALPINPTNLLKYNLTWSTDGLINEYCNPGIVLRNGKKIIVDPLEDYELITINGQSYEAFNTSGGIGSLVETYENKIPNIDYKTIRYIGHRDYMKFLLNDLGFKNRKDDLVSIFNDNIPKTNDDVVKILIKVSGYIDDKLYEKNYCHNIYGMETTFYNNEKIRFSAIQAATAYGLIYSIHSVILDSQLKNTFIKQENIPCVSLNHFKY